MTNRRHIDPGQFKPVESEFAPGGAPLLQWIKIAELVVDETYQRPIAGAGRTNVRKIAEGFCWSKFAPVIVAPVEGGCYAIIDGQHRCTAAALRGVESVPCQVVIASEREQAEAFKAINGAVTKIHSLALHHAALAAGDVEAAEIDRVARAGGVTILRYPKQLETMAPGETMALGTIRADVKAFGADVVTLALRCITGTSNSKSAGVLCVQIIHAVCAVVGGNNRWFRAGDHLLAAFDEIDLLHELEEAKLTRRPKLIAVWEILAERLKAEIAQALSDKAAA